MTSKTRVSLADDHPLLMAGFAMALADFGIEVIAKNRTPDEAIASYGELKPDVLVLDIKFAGQKSGLDAAKAVLTDFPDAKIVFLSQFDSDSLITEAYKIGGYAYVTKDREPSELAAAIKKAQQRSRFFLPAIAERLAVLSIGGDSSPLAVLDSRELDVFKLMAQGLTLAEIAQRLDLSIKTISNTSLSIKDKLGTQRIADLTLLAVKHGLIEL